MLPVVASLPYSTNHNNLNIVCSIKVKNWLQVSGKKRKKKLQIGYNMAKNQKLCGLRDGAIITVHYETIPYQPEPG